MSIRTVGLRLWITPTAPRELSWVELFIIQGEEYCSITLIIQKGFSKMKLSSRNDYDEKIAAI